MHKDVDLFTTLSTWRQWLHALTGLHAQLARAVIKHSIFKHMICYAADCGICMLYGTYMVDLTRAVLRTHC